MDRPYLTTLAKRPGMTADPGGRASIWSDKRKGPPEAGFSNYRLSTGGGSRRQIPWLVE